MALVFLERIMKIFKVVFFFLLLLLSILFCFAIYKKNKRVQFMENYFHTSLHILRIMRKNN